MTELLQAYRDGDREALDLVFTTVYDELRRRACRQRRSAKGVGTLNTTGLVHEAYLKLVRSEGDLGQDRGHFLAIAARAMRQILVDYARGSTCEKRGGQRARIDRDPDQIAFAVDAERILAVNEALGHLRAMDDRLVQVVECRYFAGLTAQETAEAIGISRRTVHRSWKVASAFLEEQLKSASSGQV